MRRIVYFALVISITYSCNTIKKVETSPSKKFEGDYSIIVNEVISYGKENMSYMFPFTGCTTIKSVAHLDENYYCQFKLWRSEKEKLSDKETMHPDSTFLFNEENFYLPLNLDKSKIDHCINIIEGEKSGILTSNLPKGTLMFSPLVPTTSPNFFVLWVHVARDRDPPELAFSILKEGEIYRVVSGSWDDQCF